MVAKTAGGVVWMSVLVLAVGCAQKGEAEKAVDAAGVKAAEKGVVALAEKMAETPWESLFDGKELGKWTAPEFGGEGEVKVKDGAILLPMGAMLTGVTYTGEVPRINYELELDAMRVDGSDFFCGLTVPVNESSVSLILGGWGGALCGISCLDGYDAANNETTTIREFKRGQWYRVRMRVMESRLMAWIDDKEVVDVNTKGRKLDVRSEVELCKPLGLGAWQTTGAIKNIRIRLLKPEEVTEKPEDKM